MIYLWGEVFYIDVEIVTDQQLGCTVKVRLESTALSSASKY
ncbi:hypothetical protein [Photorhabdus sp. CRCIA-P01]|nr:hypothetical protein [Photorhabdus sp. CRCIA-P01]